VERGIPFGWLAWSNPVTIWWGFLLIVSAANIDLWLALHRYFRGRTLALTSARGRR
jgi:hypothetical protein